MKIAFTNVCSLRNKSDELLLVAQEVDVIGLAETWLSSEEDLVLPGFIIHRSDRKDRVGGGCALAIKEHLPNTCQNEIHIGTNIQMVQCDVCPSGRLSIICVYRSPCATDAENISLITALRSALMGRQRWAIIGDFNAPNIDWGSESLLISNSFDEQLLEFIHDTSSYQHIREPTRFREGQIPSLLDLVITPYESDVNDLTISHPLGKSDHVFIQCDIVLKSPRPHAKLVKQYRKMNTANILADAVQLHWYGGCTESTWQQIKNNIIMLEERHVPIGRLPARNSRPWYAGFAKKWSLKKRLAWRQYKRHPNTQRWGMYKRARNTCIYVMRDYKRKYEMKLAQDIKHAPKRFFSYVQSHTRLRRQVPRIIQTEQGLVEGDLQIAEEMRRFFMSVFRLDSGVLPTQLQNHSSAAQVEHLRIEESETLRELNSLKADKSPGPDGLHPAILKVIAPVIAPPLTHLFNLTLEKGTIPDDWKTATVIPIHKGQDISRVTNYRPVSLTSILSKTLERMIRNHISSHLMRHKLLNPAQHGFIKGRSCLTNLLRTLDEVTAALDRGSEVRIGYLDFAKAFDCVNHRLLGVKLRCYGIHEELCKWIMNFLSNRSFSVKVRDATSELAYPSSGVPQGTVLGPLLFIIYVNDLPVGLNSSCFMFADDVKLLSTVPGSSQMQSDLNKVAQWSEDWDLPLNSAKCSILTNSSQEDEPLTLGDNSIAKAEEVRDLGIKVNNSFKPSAQCIAAANKARRALFVLRGAVSSREANVWLPLYCAYVRPHLEYCVQAWSPYLKKDVEILEGVQRMATRWVKGLNDIPYEERLKRLNLFSLERRRLRGDLIEVYKLTREASVESNGPFLEKRDSRQVRGHSQMLKKVHFRLDVRKYFFSQRVVNQWNALPQDVVSASTLECFKTKLDECWNTVFPHVT